MRSSRGLWVGWTDSRIADLLTRLAASTGSRFALVTSLDSGTTLAKDPYVQRLVAQHPGCTFLGDAVLVPASALAALPGMLHGFDEVWLFPERPAQAKPEGASIVAPRRLDEEDLAPALASWFAASGCTLGLGDGFGLNYVASSREIAEDVERLAGASDE